MEYLKSVRSLLASHRSYTATVVVGSLASGDFELGSSDVDLIAVFREPLDRGAKVRLTDHLRHQTLPCPAHGLDLIAYCRAEVGEPSHGLKYEFSIASGASWQDEVSFGGEYAGGLIDLAAARQFGFTVEALSVASLIGPVEPELVRIELGRALRWHLDRIHDSFHDPLGSNAVLNACRARHFLGSGTLVSKSRGAEGFLNGPDGDLVHEALEARRAHDVPPLDKPRVRDFVERALLDFA